MPIGNIPRPRIRQGVDLRIARDNSRQVDPIANALKREQLAGARDRNALAKKRLDDYETDRTETESRRHLATALSMSSNPQIGPKEASRYYKEQTGKDMGIKFKGDKLHLKWDSDDDYTNELEAYPGQIEAGLEMFGQGQSPGAFQPNALAGNTDPFAGATFKRTKRAEGKKEGPNFKDITALRKEFVTNSAEYRKVRDSYTRVAGSTKNPTAAGDLSLIFNYMKMLDPGSVVRESEFAQAAATGSYGERFKAAGNRIIAGERLSEEMRADFVDKAGVLYEGMEDQHKQRERTYRGIAERNKYPINDVVIDLSIPKTATNPETGEKVILINGKWEEL